MSRAKSECDALITWLSLNLGKGALGALTGTDAKALAAAAHIIELYAYTSSESALVAFREVVMCMQPCTREFAFHAIAHVMEWDDRTRLWARAGLPSLGVISRCKGERR